MDLAYDALDRLVSRTYPDATTETFTYQQLDLVEQKDRLGRITRHFYDGYGRRIATRDPLARTVSYVWCKCDELEALVDAKGNRTSWERDANSRVTRELRADGTTDTLYTYDLAGRLKTITDPMDQVTTYTYDLDDSLASTGFTNETIATPDISHTYDTYYPRPATIESYRESERAVIVCKASGLRTYNGNRTGFENARVAPERGARWQEHRRENRQRDGQRGRGSSISSSLFSTGLIHWFGGESRFQGRTPSGIFTSPSRTPWAGKTVTFTSFVCSTRAAGRFRSASRQTR